MLSTDPVINKFLDDIARDGSKNERIGILICLILYGLGILSILGFIYYIVISTIIEAFK